MSLSGFSEGTSRSYEYHVQGVDNLLQDNTDYIPCS
jgi:hypothetical protein